MLDLSYNRLSALSVANLSRLPSLRELDLTGNELDRLGRQRTSSTKEGAMRGRQRGGGEPD